MDLRAKTVKLSTKLFVRSFLLRLKYGTKKSGWRSSVARATFFPPQLSAAAQQSSQQQADPRTSTCTIPASPLSFDC